MSWNGAAIFLSAPTTPLMLMRRALKLPAIPVLTWSGGVAVGTTAPSTVVRRTATATTRRTRAAASASASRGLCLERCGEAQGKSNSIMPTLRVTEMNKLNRIGEVTNIDREPPRRYFRFKSLEKENNHE